MPAWVAFLFILIVGGLSFLAGVLWTASRAQSECEAKLNECRVQYAAYQDQDD